LTADAALMTNDASHITTIRWMHKQPTAVTDDDASRTMKGMTNNEGYDEQWVRRTMMGTTILGLPKFGSVRFGQVFSEPRTELLVRFR
jgi:hypothetical protein